MNSANLNLLDNKIYFLIKRIQTLTPSFEPRSFSIAVKCVATPTTSTKKDSNYVSDLKAKSQIWLDVKKLILLI